MFHARERVADWTVVPFKHAMTWAGLGFAVAPRGIWKDRIAIGVEVSAAVDIAIAGGAEAEERVHTKVQRIDVGLRNERHARFFGGASITNRRTCATSW